MTNHQYQKICIANYKTQIFHSVMHTSLKEFCKLNPQKIPTVVPINLSDLERQQLTSQITQLLQQNNALLIAHYYTDPDIQRIADATGGCISDSLEMARFGHASNADILVICGVKFMGETAKILNPEKTILMPDLNSTCSLDLGCPIKEFSEFCDQHPDRTVVVYTNTSAAVKARSDWVVTSSSALDIIKHLQKKGEKILWAPDKYLGQYIQEKTNADMLMWQSTCIVHEEFKGQELALLMQEHPDARVLAHPECPSPVLKLAHFIGSTTSIINETKENPAKKFIVATDSGLTHKMQQASPDKTFITAPTSGKSATCKSCAHCPWMAMNNLEKIVQCLIEKTNTINIDAETIKLAYRPIQRLLNFAEKNQQQIFGNNDA